MEIDWQPAIEPLAPEWDALADRMSAPPWQRPGWIAAWWDAFGRGRLEVVCARRGGELGAVLPLRRHRGALLSASNWHSPAFGVLAADPEAAAALASALFGQGARRVELRLFPRGQVWLDESRAAARAAGYRVVERTLQRSPYLDMNDDWPAFQSGRHRSLLRNLDRRRRRLAELGSVTVEFHDGRERLAELLDEGFRVEAMGWKGKQGTAVLSRASSARYYERLAALAAERGWLCLVFLRLNGRAIAFDMNMQDPATMWGIKTGYDPAFARFSPGRLLIEAEVRHCFAAGVRRFEFLGPDQPYKLEWATGAHELELLQAFAPTPAGVVDRLASTHARRVARRVITPIRGRRAAPG